MTNGADGWGEARMYVTAMLERHENQVVQLQEQRTADREEMRDLLRELEDRLIDRLDAKFAESQNGNEPDPALIAENIRGTWTFRGLLLSSAVAVVMAILGLLT